jgi:hypothetical protein
VFFLVAPIFPPLADKLNGECDSEHENRAANRQASFDERMVEAMQPLDQR